MASRIDTKSDIHRIAEKHVIRILRELMSDPDYGFVLRHNFIRRLKKSVQSKQKGTYKDLNDVLNQ